MRAKQEKRENLLASNPPSSPYDFLLENPAGREDLTNGTMHRKIKGNEKIIAKLRDDDRLYLLAVRGGIPKSKETATCRKGRG